MKKTIFTILTCLSFQAQSQNLFPVKLNNCKVESFCLDCGETKGGYKNEEFIKLQEKLNAELKLNGITGAVKFQVLIDSKGRGCVLSHTDLTNNKITRKIVDELNKFKMWTPAITEGKIEEKTSINLVFSIQNNIISGQIERVDIDEFEKTFDKPNSPEIFNKEYVYKNENLSNYKFTIWNSSNSNLPNNLNDHISIDTNGIVWLTIDEGIVTFDGNKFSNAEQNITEKGDFFSYFAITTDNNNVKWINATGNIYSYDDKKWTKYDPALIGIDGVYEIINNPKTGEVFFCSDEGLTIYKDGNWSNINKSKVSEFPSDRVTFAKRDSKNRIWIGTFSGSVMIDGNGKATNFEKSESVLKGKCITSMDEDKNGNLYFSLYQFDDEKGEVNRNEGIAIRNVDGTWKQLTTKNSGMPFNHTNCVLYDKIENVLWISTDRAGLVRYDFINNIWENYHNENSSIPTSYISTMTFDKDGNLFLATRQGLVKIERK